MPPPVDAQQLPTGELKYSSKQGKRQFTVSVVSRNAQADRQQGNSDESVLQAFGELVEIVVLPLINDHNDDQVDVVGVRDVGDPARTYQTQGE